MKLIDLVGEHWLSGVDRGKREVESMWGGAKESADFLNFTLDDVIYSAVEDPEDGYRSCMKDLVVAGEPTTFNFPPCRVMGIYHGEPHNDILELVDVLTGSSVLKVGTEDIDDYYPGFIANWDPLGMACNQAREENNAEAL